MNNKVKIGEDEYTISPIPPRLLPYASLLDTLNAKKPENLEEAKEIGKQIDQVMSEILDATVKPAPKLEHKIALYNAVARYGNLVVGEALEPFRLKPPDSKKSRRSQSVAASTPKPPA